MAIWDNVKIIPEIIISEEQFYHALELYGKDVHKWSSRPCSTCLNISEIIGRPFGCNRLSNPPQLESQVLRDGA